MARFALNQSARVIDVDSVHHDSVGRGIVVTPRQDRSSTGSGLTSAQRAGGLMEIGFKP